MSELPKSWEAAPIRSLMQPLADGKLVHQGWSPQCESGPARSDSDWGALKTTAIQDGAYLPEHNKRLPDSLDPKERLEVQAGDLLMTCAGPRVRCGVACLVRETPARRFISGKMYRFRANDQLIDPRLFEAFLRTPETKIQIDAMKTGISESGMNITHERFSQLVVPLAPRSEQKRIADKLDTVLTRVDAVNTRLARIAPILKRFRQSVLAAATSGRLTGDWRDANKAAAWTPRTVESLCLHISDGPFGSNLKSDDYTDAGARVVRLENIGHLNFDAAKETFISLDKYETLKKHTLLPGDLLFSSFVDEEVRVCEFPTDIDEPTINKADCFCVRVDKAQVVARFLAFRLACKSTYQALKDLVHGATRPRINLRQLRGFEVMLPTADEQAEIVRRVETLFAFADRLEARLQTAQTATERLTPALLAKAFRGELVPQDPNDEPASELLKRLAATATASAPKRGRRKAADAAA